MNIETLAKHNKKKNNNEKEKNNDKKLSQIDDIGNKNQLNKLFWIRIGLAVIGGFVATFLFDSIEGETRRWSSILFMILIFILSFGIARILQIQAPLSNKKKIITTGIGSYIFIYLFVWILTYTFKNIPAD